MADPKSERTPLLVEGVDMRSLPIGPTEAFVLSRVDGASSGADIAAATGIEAGEVGNILAKLEGLGAVTFGVPRGTEPPPEVNNHAVAGRLAHPVIEAASDTSAERHPAAALYDPEELDEDVDLDLPKKRLILDTFYSLDSMTHYALLGVPEDADKKHIKEAYYRVVAQFHPDKYFGKNTGTFRTKLERIFSRLTEAHDVLTRRKPREEYDAYLSMQSRRHALGNAARGTPRPSEIDRLKRELEERARIAERAAAQPPPKATTARPADPRERKRALARKLRASTPPARRSSSTPPPDQAAVKAVVADELRRRYESRIAGMKHDQLAMYVAAADKAYAEDDKASAANALRIAASLAPDDEALQNRLDELQKEVNAELAETYLQSAQYEERNRRYLQAAESYQKAARGKLPGRAAILERAAFCLVEGEGDLRKASDLAKDAILIAPESPAARVTLARIYVALNLKKSALGEFERAAALAPLDDRIKDWIKRLKRGEV